MKGGSVQLLLCKLSGHFTLTWKWISNLSPPAISACIPQLPEEARKVLFVCWLVTCGPETKQCVDALSCHNPTLRNKAVCWWSLSCHNPTLRNKDDDDVELHVLGCRVDILGTNCDQCRSTVQCCFTSTETIRLIRTESPGKGSKERLFILTRTCTFSGKSLCQATKRYLNNR